MARLVVNVATDVKVADELRLLAVRVLGKSVECDECVGGLLQLVDGGRTFLGRRKLAARTPMFLAALRALADGWSTHPRAAALLAKASKSSDAEIRQAAAPSVP